MTPHSLSPEDLAILDMDRRGALLVRLPGDVGGGESSLFNFGVWCGECEAFLARVGASHLRDPAPAVAAYPHRLFHCLRCHAFTIVEDHNDRISIGRVVGSDATLGPDHVCKFCPKAGEGGVHAPEGQIGIASAEELLRLNKLLS